MMLLVSGSTVTVARLARSWPHHLGHLLTPKNRNTASVLQTGLRWGLDNGAYRGFDPVLFSRRLAWAARHPQRCLWVVCPDVVADARATLERFKIWQEAIRQTGLPLAFVGQDGAEDLDIPWENFACWFIGGSTRWKLSQASADLALEAKRRGQWLHMGRVNSLRRLQAAFDMGCDSTDGSSHSMFGDKYIYRDLAWLLRLHDQPVLWR